MPGGESFCYTVQRREAWNMSEKKTKPKYSSVENVGWMIANAWRECKSVLLICFIIAVVSVALNLTELFIAPQILQRVENGAEVSLLLLTIAVFSGTLFLLLVIIPGYFEPPVRVFGATVPEKESHKFQDQRATSVLCL